ncbi:MAG: hypothetical protein RLZZ398_1089 [Verrucomicrobiota bacterium]|jgi:hypothetical protein
MSRSFEAYFNTPWCSIKSNVTDAEHPRGEHAPSRVVFSALAKDERFRPFHAVFDEGVENNTRGRVCSPRFLDQRFRARWMPANIT